MKFTGGLSESIRRKLKLLIVANIEDATVKAISIEGKYLKSNKEDDKIKSGYKLSWKNEHKGEAKGEGSSSKEFYCNHCGLRKALKGKPIPKTLIEGIATQKADDNEEEDWEDLDSRATNGIRLYLAKNILANVVREKTTKGLWEKLESLYQAKSLSNRLYFKVWLYTPKMNKGTSVGDYLGSLNGIVSELESIRVKVEDEDKRDNIFVVLVGGVFIASECCLGLTYHGKALDTWAVGVTLYHMLVGQYPFLGHILQDTYDMVFLY
ncbi:hypothetical protein GIB67_027721 [Kingdonia uniflora]|uniref:Uncharacterized protein n=1 Tax=Kingdonia uniflora TaxID=39325 RepID=A0A7J7NLH0_9MAGN|nr:hypothetical protein GIB67_027721 [Kingdonia uniflora]